MNFLSPLLALLTCGFGVVSIGAFTLNERGVGVVFGIAFLVAAAAAVINVVVSFGREPAPDEYMPPGSDLPGEELVMGHPARGDDVGRY
jgi:hypothetical protein